MGLSCLSLHWESSTAPNGLVEKERRVMIEFIVLKFKRQRFPEGEIIVRQTHCLDCDNHVINGCLKCLQPQDFLCALICSVSNFVILNENLVKIWFFKFPAKKGHATLLQTSTVLFLNMFIDFLMSDYLFDGFISLHSLKLTSESYCVLFQEQMR